MFVHQGWPVGEANYYNRHACVLVMIYDPLAASGEEIYSKNYLVLIRNLSSIIIATHVIDAVTVLSVCVNKILIN